MTPEQAAALRAPFDASEIGKLPRVTCPTCSDKKRTCDQHKKQKCETCGAYISTAHIHLDYVGHAGVTDRLLRIDPGWSWEPVAWTTDGFPAIITAGTESWLWVRLTVCDVTRFGVGTAAAGSFELPKQLISDAIRNASMRFGVALDLWAKEPLGGGDDHEQPKPAKKPGPKKPLEGWESYEAQAARHKAFSEHAKDASDEVRAQLRSWREASGLEGWPLPYAQFDAVEQKFLELTNPVPDPETEPF